VPVSSTLWFGAFIGAPALSWVISLKQVTNPVVLLGFAAVEGILVGVVSKVFTQYAGGVVAQAILATLCTAAVVHALYAFRIVRVTNRTIRIVVAVTIGFVLTRLVPFALAAVNIYPGGFDFGALDLILTRLALRGVPAVVLDPAQLSPAPPPRCAPARPSRRRIVAWTTWNHCSTWSATPRSSGSAPSVPRTGHWCWRRSSTSTPAAR